MDNNVAKIRAVVETEDKNSGAVFNNIGNKATSTAKKFESGFRKAGLALIAVGAGLTLYAKNATDFTKNLVIDTKKLSREIGTNYKDSSRLLYVTNKLGVSADEASTSFGIFSKNIKKAKDESKGSTLQQQKLAQQIQKLKIEIKATNDQIAKNGDKTGALRNKVVGLNIQLKELNSKAATSGNVFKSLGISITDASGKMRPFNDILLQTADKFKSMADGPTKTALAMQLFGRSGKDMIPILNKGSQGIQDLMQQADKLGLTIDSKTVGSVMKLVQSQQALKETSDAMKIAVGTLTAPVLTDFNNKLNGVIQTLLQADGPIKTVTANILAFGGPVATAAGSLLELGSNAISVAPAFANLAKSAAFLRFGFIGLVATVGIGIVSAYIGAINKTDDLKNAQDRLKASTEQVKNAEKDYRNALLNQQGAALQVEQAQRNYNETVRKFGRSSLPARQALYDLKVAQNNFKNSQDQTKLSLNSLTKKEKENARDRALENKLKRLSNNSRNAAGGFNALASAISNAKKEDKKSGLSGIGPREGRAVFSIPKRAGGGDVKRSSPYIVGENGPELMVPDNSGTIIPASKTKSLLNSPNRKTIQSTPSTIKESSQVVFNFHFNGVFTGNEVEMRKLAKKVFQSYGDLAGSKGKTIGQMIGV